MRKYIILFFLFFAFPSLSQENDKGYCPSSLTFTQCSMFKEKVKEKLANNKPKSSEDLINTFHDVYKELFKDAAFYQSFLDSPSVRTTLDSSPVSLEFKMIDREEEDSVVGLEFGYSRSSDKKNLGNDGKRKSNFYFNFDINGTVTQKAEENPRNFIEAKVSAKYSNDPVFSIPSGLYETEPLLNEGLKKYCLADIDDAADEEICNDFDKAVISALFGRPEGFSFFDFGLNVGYESDQSFNATNRTIGGFVYYTYENRNPQSFFGIYKLKPALLLSVETINPSSETPRALAGDESNYERISYQFSVNIPLSELLSLPFTFTYNFRGYEELNASDIVKQANLDKYRLRTYSLAIPMGLVVSYSSGRLPFGIEEENMVSLGFQTYF